LADTRAEHFYYDEPFGKPTALVMGSERYGISREWYDFDYEMIAIPMLGKCDSLNVGVAATVLCYDACMKNKMK
jgi:TrmH family RNA methyltransferase